MARDSSEIHPARENELRTTVENDAVALGVLDDLYSPAMVEIYGDLGFEFVWEDLEHAGPAAMDGDALANLLRAADTSDTELLVRVPEPSPATVHKVLDVGVRNVFISHVETPADVERATNAARFTHDGGPGGRGFANQRASRWGRAEEYVETEDREVMIGITMEEPSAIERIDEVLAVPGLDFVFVGPLDIAVATGHPGEPDHPEVREAVETVVESALEADVTLGGLGFDEDDVDAKAADGYQILNVGTTTGAAIESLQSWPGRFDD